MTHDELAGDLANHLAATRDRMVWCDMQLGPAGSPRPDVYTIARSFANPRPLAYECKVSLSDFRADVTHGKYLSYLKYASGVIFAVPAGLISKADIPARCGLMTRSETGWRAVKGPTLSAVTLPAEAWLKLLIDGVGRAAARQAAKQREVWCTESKLAKRHGARIARIVADKQYADLLEAQIADRIDEARRQAQDAEKNVRDYARQQTAALDVERRQVAELLGLHPETCWRDVLTVAAKIRRQIDHGQAIQSARDALQSARRAIEWAEKDVAVPPWSGDEQAGRAA